MFGLSFWEISVIFVIALLVLGPKRLPQVAKTIGKGLRELRRASSDLRSSLEGPLEEVRRPLEDMRDDLIDTVRNFEDEVQSEATKDTKQPSVPTNRLAPSTIKDDVSVPAEATVAPPPSGPESSAIALSANQQEVEALYTSYTLQAEIEASTDKAGPLAQSSPSPTDNTDDGQPSQNPTSSNPRRA